MRPYRFFVNNPEASTDIASLPPQIESIEIIELLGKGGMSLVYKGRQKQLDRIVAVKVLSKLAVRGEEALKRFQQEGKLTSTLQHPNIVKTISFGISKDEQPYLVMEYLEGLSLAEDLKRNGRPKLTKFRDVFLPILSALGQAHEAGLVHRDIKPGNIMICKNEDGTDTAKLVDFGIARVLADGESKSQNLTKTGVVLGSPAYMSPEQCQGNELDRRSDIYSMACVMYEALSGEPPFTGNSLLEVMQKHVEEPTPDVSELRRKIDIDKNLAQVTLWGLAKDPAERPQTALEFARKLNAVIEEITLDKVPRLKNSGAANVKKFNPNSVIFIALAILCLALFCGKIVSLSTMKPKSPTHAMENLHKLSQDELEEKKVKDELLSMQKFGRENIRVAPYMDKLAELYLSHRKVQEAEPLYRTSLAIKEKTLSANDPQIATALINLTVCMPQNRWSQKQKMLERALAILKKAHKPGEPDELSVCLSNLATCYIDKHDFANAESLLRRAYALNNTALGTKNKFSANTLCRLGDLLVRERKYAEAESQFDSAIAILKSLGEEYKNELDSALLYRGTCYDDEGKQEKAISSLEELKALLEPDSKKNSRLWSATLIKLGICYQKKGKYKDAESLLKQALEVRSKDNPVDENELAAAYYHLGNFYLASGKSVQAESMLESSLALIQKTGATGGDITTSLIKLAEIKRKLGKLAEADQLLKRVNEMKTTAN